MRQILALGLGAFLGASVLSAQSNNPAPQPGTQTTQTMVVVTHPDGTWTTTTSAAPMMMCPVAMEAKQGSGGGLIAAREKTPPKADGLSQSIHLVLVDLKNANVSGGRVRVYGLSGKNRRLQTVGSGPENSDMTRTMEVSFAPEGKNRAAADLVLPGFTAVTRVVLQMIEYDDGSTWRPAGHQSCSVKPDPFMLVAGR